MTSSHELKDSFGRTINNMRISVTDRCNFRCHYCMPEEGMVWMKKDELLSFEEITRIVGIVARLGVNNVTLVPETRDVFDYFVTADLFVCSSFEESFPRVVMEAMAFRTPMVTTDVHGIAEMIGQRQDGYLVPPGDPLALSRMMWTCLAAG